MTKKLLTAIAFCLSLLPALASCSSGGTASSGDMRQLQIYGSEFVTQLNDDVIYLRESPEALLELDAIVVLDDKTHNLGKLDAFYERYKVGEQAELLVVFCGKSFVVNKILFENGKGYYYRYEYDKFHEKDINVESQLLDKVSINRQPELFKVDFTLQKAKMTDILITFKNIAEESEQ